MKPPAAQSARFRAVKADVAAKRTKLAAHAPPAAESKASQDAAVAPPDDKEAQGKAANAEKMNAAKPGEFDKKAFVDAVNKAIDAQAPKNLDEADKFAKSGKAEQVKAEVDGKVTDGKESSAKDIETATKAPPDTSAAQEKAVTPLTPDRPPADPGAPSATDAVPEKQPAAVTDFSEGPAANDKAMADAEVTEEQLARSNEPEFTEALSAKKTAETDSEKAPAKGRSAEDQQLSAAKANAAASGAQAMTALTATRSAAGKQVDGGKNDTKSKDEKKRAEVTAKLQKVYDSTKKDVEETLSGLDKKVDTAFTSGEKAARDAFTAVHKSRMKKYKDKRYSGLRGKARWVKDKFAGLPKEANDLYQESRKLYVSRMQTVISSVADLIGAELGRAKARIAKGRTELKAEVDRLPADLRQFGEEAAKDFAGKFDDLEATVDEKSEQLVQDLASKYTAALNKIDEEIKKLQEANKGLIDKAKDAIAGVIKTINELKTLLLGILAKAASAIMKIIKDPIGFLGNLVTAVGAGLNLFITNIADHLKTGLVSWLLGTAVKAGLDLPARFDLKGIIHLIGGLLGLTWDNIRTRITRKGVPDEAMSKVETSVPVAASLAREGPAGAAKEIQAETGDLKSTILSKLTTYLIPTVLIAGITWIVSLLNPASAFVRAVKGIIDIVTFIVTQGAQIADFVNAVLDAVIAIANGAQAGVPKLIEAALATSVPLLIGFLAALLGIGGLANKVKSVFQSVSRPVTRAIDKLVDFITKKGRALWARQPREKPGKSPTKMNSNARSSRKPNRENTLKIISSINSQANFTIFDHEHTIKARGTGSGRLLTTLASNQEEDFKKKVRRVRTALLSYPTPRRVGNVLPGDIVDRLHTSIATADRVKESFGAWKRQEEARATPDPSAANRIKQLIDAWIVEGRPALVDESDIPKLPPGYNKHREVLYEGNGNRFQRAKIAVIARDFPGIFDDVAAAIKPYKDAREAGEDPAVLREKKAIAASKLRDMTMIGAAKDDARVPVKVLKEFKRKGDINSSNMRASKLWNVDHIVPLAAHWHAIGYNSKDNPRVDATPEVSNLQLIAADANKSAQADYEGERYEFMKKQPGPDFETEKLG
ncbi:phage tail protein [Streptomyces bacillaris]|uniref:phage tail protein n=1 Tax=Streptomyces bacillaris TaxID=68179 RepID=UPI00382D3247